MRTFHIGSLPYTDVDRAIDYSFKYDIPTLFTLPKKDTSELIGLDIINRCGYSVVQYSDLQNLSMKNLDPNLFVPYYFDEFKSHYLSLKKTKSKIKYQCVGPITLFKILNKYTKCTFEEVNLFLISLYKNIAKQMEELAPTIMVIDEPFLAREISLVSNLSNFLNQFKPEFAEVIVHCCDYLEVNKTEQLNFPLSLDYNLYQKGDDIKPLAVGFTNIANIKKINHPEFFQRAKYITPSCGLSHLNSDKCEIVLENLNYIKNQTHPI